MFLQNTQYSLINEMSESIEVESFEVEIEVDRESSERLEMERLSDVESLEVLPEPCK